MGSLTVLGVSSQTERHASASSTSRRGRRDSKEPSLSPPRSQSLRSGTGSTSSRRTALSPSTSTTSSRRRSTRGAGKNGDAGTGKHHRRRSSGVHGAATANKSIFAAAATTAANSAGDSGVGDSRSSRRSSRSPRPRSRSPPRQNDKDGGKGDGNDNQLADASSSRRRRSRKDAGEIEQDAGGEPAIAGKAATADGKSAQPLAEEETAVATATVQEGQARADIVPRMRPVSASPVVDGSDGHRRRWSRSSKKVGFDRRWVFLIVLRTYPKSVR